MEADFSGYATKAGLKCTDGRTIMPEAFKHQDKMTVPLVWQHGHNDPANVLGHAILEARDDGIYAQGFFNKTPSALNAKALVEHKDINALSIYANQLVERTKQVFHGVIREVSLVLSGANPGAFIDFVAVQHSDGDVETLSDEAVIYTGLELSHSDDGANAVGDEEKEDLEHADDDTIKDVYDTLNEDQKNVVHYMIGQALEQAGTAVSQSDESKEGDLVHKEGTDVSRTNVFEQNNTSADGGDKHVLTHDAVKGIVADAQKIGSLKEAVENYALQHGIDNIDVLFPEARNIDSMPEFISRRVEWVAGVLNGTRKSPFSRIRTRNADITMEEARAKGYIKGTMKKEEFFSVAARTTAPTTIYKKQKLDRDDMLDITDFDVVVWLKAEMRLMLEEELARAVLIGDGRAVDDEDKIKDPIGATDGTGIRSILHDHEMYVTHVNVNIGDADSTWNEVVETLMRNRRFYKGSGTPTLYTTNLNLVEMLLIKDNYGRRLYNSKQELSTALMVSDIVEVEVMETIPSLLGIIVNLNDYTIGADKGGEINLFDFFDIDYNQFKYLIETRVVGSLVKLKSAIVVSKVPTASVLVVPTKPTFVQSTGVITIPTDVNVDYFLDGSTIADAATHTVAAGDSALVEAQPAAGKYFSEDGDSRWTFYRDHA